MKVSGNEKFTFIALILLILLLWCQLLYGSAGTITEITGKTRITRGDQFITGELKTGIESMDKVETLDSKTGITFIDDTHVTVGEHSKLVIDDFVFDPKSSSGKLGIKASFGTVRYLSGRIAHNKSSNVNVITPTASIAVRGTDFSMSVDESGKSLIILLPTKVGNEYVVGKIDVTTLAGTVTLDKAFQGTTAATVNMLPSKPVIFKMDTDSVGNNLILAVPTHEQTPEEKAMQKAALDLLEQEQEVSNLYAQARAKESKGDKFVFVDDQANKKLEGGEKGNKLKITVAKGENVTVNYYYVGGSSTAKNGTGTGVTINITQK